jgi:hypothetical protein
MDELKAFRFLNRLRIEPVLVDVGSAGDVPSVWRAIAPGSVYIGFDADSRDLPPSPSAFKQAKNFGKAVADTPNGGSVSVNLTSFPHCSSVLKPNPAELDNYLYADLFDVVGTEVVSSITLNAAIRELGAGRIDWLKLDTQGTDHRIYASLSPENRRGLLAVDIEPGLIAAYSSEDTFDLCHASLIKDGFWLSNLSVRGSARIRRSSLSYLSLRRQRSSAEVTGRLRASPCWVEARYFRTLEALEAISATPREYALLFVFALVDRQYGFALDLCLAYEEQFGPDETSKEMHDVALRSLASHGAVVYQLIISGVRKLVRLLPSSIKTKLVRWRDSVSC